jgi:hypothetical protein
VRFKVKQPDTKFGAPQGLYRAKFLGVEPKDHPEYGPGCEWQFEILEGDYRGKVITRTTGTEPSLKNSCGRMLTQLTGGAIALDQEFDHVQYVGRVYQVMVESNSTGNGTRVGTVMPLDQPAAPPAPGNGTVLPGGDPAQQLRGVFAAPPTRQGPPPRKAPAAPSSPARRFYVYTTQDDSGNPVTMDEKELHDYVHTSQRAPGTVMVCAVGEDEWKTALDYGVKDQIPF